MEAKVFVVDKKKAEEIVNNEDVKRKGEAKYFEARQFDINGDFVVIVKGPAELFEVSIFNGLKELEGREKEKVLKKLKEIEESSAMGVGLIFG